MTTLYRKIENEVQTLHTDEACTSEPHPFPFDALRLVWVGDTLTVYEEGDQVPDVVKDEQDE